MLNPELIMDFIAPLERAGIEYMVTGSVASIIYGEPRLTHDVDLVLSLEIENASELTDIFPLKGFYVPPVEVIRSEILRGAKGHFNIITLATGFKADIYPAGIDELHQWALAKKRRFQFGEVSIWMAPPEYVILRKLEYYKEGESDKHLRDISNMLKASGDMIDFEFLEKMIAKNGLTAQWQLASDKK